ncbi:MAG: type II toxin-antitoxin system mRNA interferase toxin, RelE/StbE family [Anaerolineae bacterium]|nr:type II toxin-antitoxin system mRNA interferase toxin, RelE/StbE family [Anaerolineae bacterium]
MTPLVLKQKIRRNPELREQVERTLRQLTGDPFHPSLHSHKLKGSLAGTWASVAYDQKLFLLTNL